MPDHPYSRVYHSIIDDPKFAGVYDDDRRLATWLRLLIVAEQAYPGSAYVPAGTNRAALSSLVDAGLVDLGTGSRFRLHGMRTEREMRAQSGRNAAAVRWHGNGNATQSDDALLVREREREENEGIQGRISVVEGTTRNGRVNPR